MIKSDNEWWWCERTDFYSILRNIWKDLNNSIMSHQHTQYQKLFTYFFLFYWWILYLFEKFIGLLWFWSHTMIWYEMSERNVFISISHSTMSSSLIVLKAFSFYLLIFSSKYIDFTFLFVHLGCFFFSRFKNGASERIEIHNRWRWEKWIKFKCFCFISIYFYSLVFTHIKSIFIFPHQIK